MLSNIRNRKERGFTIIEVLIVLAIAGLILLVVFLAVPALQRNARNTQRKNDVAGILGGLSEYVNNNNGSLPANATNLGSGTSATIGATGTNQVTVNLGYYDAANVSISSTVATNNPNNQENVIIVKGGKCGTGTSVGNSVAGGSTRGFVVLYTAETNSKQCSES